MSRYTNYFCHVLHEYIILAFLSNVSVLDYLCFILILTYMLDNYLLSKITKEYKPYKIHSEEIWFLTMCILLAPIKIGRVEDQKISRCSCIRI